MTVENHWRQLKRIYLHLQTRPRLDHMLWILCTQAVPDFIQRAEGLNDGYRLGRARPLTTSQRAFKKSWGQQAAAKINGEYVTDVARWQCSCRAQELNAHHLCKHLVQAVPPPPMNFFSEVIRRRTIPLYRHPNLHPFGSSPGAYVTDGSVSDGDDHEIVGGRDVLKSAVGVDGKIGWAAVLSGEARDALDTRKRARVEEEEGDGGRVVRPRIDDGDRDELRGSDEEREDGEEEDEREEEVSGSGERRG